MGKADKRIDATKAESTVRTYKTGRTARRPDVPFLHYLKSNTMKNTVQK